MALNSEQKRALKEIYGRLADASLEPGSELYEPVYQSPALEDPVALMQQHIEWSGVESVQMFSGFRGSGKTTELLRLKQALEGQGYFIVYGDALEYLNPAEEIDIAGLLLVLAGTFNDALEARGLDIGSESYWSRLRHFLTKTDVNIEELGLTGGTKLSVVEATAELKLSLKTTPSFRQRLRAALANRLGELKREVNTFFEVGIKAIQKKHGAATSVVFLFDQLEQIRGTLSTEDEVIHSVERLFAQHMKLLEIPFLHIVYTVPPWLKFVLPNIARIQMLPSIRQWNNDETRSQHAPGWTALRSLARRRFGQEGFALFFGATGSEHALCDQLIAVCGGHFRDLLRLLREAALRARELPVNADIVESAIDAVRSNFLPIANDDAVWLDRIATMRGAVLPTTEQKDVARLTRFLDTHFVLYFANGKEWYDVHPLIRDEVRTIVAGQADAADGGA